jgi:riboflavin biosynthesis pyrimidine reductase
MDVTVTQLYPAPNSARPLQGLYLAHDLRRHASAERPFVYANFVASLDGRIATAVPGTTRLRPPPEITHPHDWRLYLELAAQADAVITSGRRLRELGDAASGELHCVQETASDDLGAWRRRHGLPPHPACIVLTSSLDLPFAALRERTHGEIAVIAGANPRRDDVEALRNTGIDVVVTETKQVSGDAVRRLARERGYATLYSIGGPEVLYALVAAGMLDRLYVSFALKLLAAQDYATLLRGPALRPPMEFDLHELYFEPKLSDNPPFLFASFNRREAAR